MSHDKHNTRKEDERTRRTGANWNDRRAWRNAVNEQLDLMRKAEAEGRMEDADSHGTRAHDLFMMGPAAYRDAATHRVETETEY